MLSLSIKQLNNTIYITGQDENSKILCDAFSSRCYPLSDFVDTTNIHFTTQQSINEIICNLIAV